MWTPKRVLLLAAGFGLFFTAYVAYAYFLGGFDGLPPLPDGYSSSGPGAEPFPEIRPPESEADKKLRQAFGEGCPELVRTIKLEMQRRGVVLAANNFAPDEGRVKLAPFSIAIFGKSADGLDPEINTIRADEAYLTFDRPIKNVFEMSRSRIIAAELRHDPTRRRLHDGEGGVSIVNNRRTPQRDDDISLFTPGPVHYADADNRNQIWTDKVVLVTDLQSKPRPTVINGIGADVYLASDPAEAKSSAARRLGPSGITGVDRIRLRSNVDMTLWVGPDSAFLSGKKAKIAPGPPTKAAKPAEKAQVVIKTQGPFTFDLRTNRATFDISREPSPFPNHVQVVRLQDGKHEQLVCDHLELQFQDKQDKAAGGANERAQALEIDKAHAWGQQVVLSSDSEGLDAFGNDLVYDARTKVTVLKGQPEMVAAKDGNEIRARELRLRNDSDGLQQAAATGPGRIELLGPKGERTQRAQWTNELISSRQGDYDMLTLTGDAVFEDREHGQHIQADRLLLWLRPSGAKGGASDLKGRLPYRLEATGRVKAVSPDLHIHDTDRLVIWFKDAAPEAGAGGQGPVASQEEIRGQGSGPPSPPTVLRPPSAGPSTGTASRKPIDLSARIVEANVLVAGNKNELEKLWCEGSVRVLQDPARPDERGVDIRGETLKLDHYPDGNEVTVTGDLAQVQMDSLFILGRDIFIDQPRNTAKVTGNGAMRLPSNTSFDGRKLTKPTDLTIHWKDTMFFNGKFAEFNGNIQAEQESARLLCETLQVFLDHPVSLRQGEKGRKPAVDKLTCDKKVRIEDTTSAGNRLLRYQRIDCTVLSLDNAERQVEAGGPGRVRILQPGPKNDGMLNVAGNARPQPARPGPVEEEMKLTYVDYFGRMWADKNKRTAIFYDDVFVVYVPTDKADLVIDRDHLPPGAVALQCEKLTVYTSREADGTTSQSMEARHKASVHSPDQGFWGYADTIKFNEKEQQVIFEGIEGSPARLYRVKTPGAAPDEIKAKRIVYLRKTGDIKVDDGQGLSVGN